MSDNDLDARVCVRCGEPAGEHRFCSECGLELAAQPELPTRRGWDEHRYQQRAPGKAEVPAVGAAGSRQATVDAANPGPTESVESPKVWPMWVRIALLPLWIVGWFFVGLKWLFEWFVDVIEAVLPPPEHDSSAMEAKSEPLQKTSPAPWSVPNKPDASWDRPLPSEAAVQAVQKPGFRRGLRVVLAFVMAYIISFALMLSASDAYGGPPGPGFDVGVGLCFATSVIACLVALVWMIRKYKGLHPEDKRTVQYGILGLIVGWIFWSHFDGSSHHGTKPPSRPPSPDQFG